MATKWEEAVANKRRRQQESIPQEWVISPPSEDVRDVTDVPEQSGVLSPLELQITGSDVDTLLSKLAVGAWSSTQVTTAFYKRAIVAHQVVNCLTEIFVERALARAAELDLHFKRTGKPVGPLHGLPISLKDQLCLKGLETTMGYVSWIGQYADHDAVLVQILYDAGAVPFVRTNVPQTLMWPETFNNVFGRTLNPFNRTLTSGGSSGGEGALIAMKGSPLGVGSDIGGSIRIPSAFCGLYGLRPSYHRIPYAGAVNSMEGQESIASVLGPLSGSLGGIKAFMRAVIESKPWTKDAYAVRKAWDEEAYRLSEHGNGGKLCLAIMWDDGIIRPHPPVRRGLQIVKDALLAAGHHVIEWRPLMMKEIYSNTSGIWNSASAEDFDVAISLSGEPLIASMNPNRATVTDASFRPSKKEPISSYDLWQLHKRKREIRQLYLEEWNRTANDTGTGRPIDAILGPAAPYVAPPHGMNKEAGYTIVWNALDYPALILPVGISDASIDVKESRHDFLSPKDKANYDFYDPAASTNAPIAVQLVGRTLEEEAVIGMGEIVDAAVRQHLRSSDMTAKL